MNFHNDVTTSTVLLSLVIAGAGYVLRGAMWALGQAIQRLINHLIQTELKVQQLDAKYGELIAAIGDVQKIRTDLNQFFARLKTLEDKVLPKP